MIKLSYLLLFIILWTAILFFYNRALKVIQTHHKRRTQRLVEVSVAMALWIFVQYMLSEIGLYNNLQLPPRIPLFMILPIILFATIFLSRNKNSAVLKAVPMHVLIAYQSFRVCIEVLFYFTFLEGILPIQVTFEGVNYDVLIGISAIPIAILSFKEKVSKKVLIAWNFLGITVVVFAAFTFISSFYFPAIWGSEEISAEFNQFPYLLLPSFFLPSAILVHALTLMKLFKKS